MLDAKQVPLDAKRGWPFTLIGRYDYPIGWVLRR
jgi:hypothetical protein